MKTFFVLIIVYKVKWTKLINKKIHEFERYVPKVLPKVGCEKYFI